jgi:hypothetical protein
VVNFYWLDLFLQYAEAGVAALSVTTFMSDSFLNRGTLGDMHISMHMAMEVAYPS